MQAKKLIIFDLDGTLVDAYKAITASFNYTMRSFGARQRSGQLIRRLVGWGDEMLLRPFIEETLLKKALAIYRRHHAITLLSCSRLLPGAQRLLKYLKGKGYKIAVASNRPTKFSRIIIRRLGLGNYFDYVLCADKLRRGKPHPEILKIILRRFSVKPKEALYVGDMAVDAQAGRRAGIKTVIVLGGSSSKKDIKKEAPFLVINRLARLLRLL